MAKYQKTKIYPRDEYLIAYKEAIRENDLNSELLSKLHCDLKKSTVEKYIYEKGRNPSFKALFELHCYLLYSKRIIPRGLNRIIARARGRGQFFAKKYPVEIKND